MPALPPWYFSPLAMRFVNGFANPSLSAPNWASYATGDDRVDRPMLGLIAQWLADGWASLASAAEPTWTLSQLENTWTPRFPFEGPSRHEWHSLDVWPASAGSPWRFGPVLPPPSFARTESPGGVVELDGSIFDPSARLSGAEWLRLEPHVFVLTQVRPPGSWFDPLGLSPEAAWMVGLGWRALAVALPRLDRWLRAEALQLPAPVEPLRIEQTGAADILGAARALVDGSSGEAVHIFGDRWWSTPGSWGSNATSSAFGVKPARVDRFNRVQGLRAAAVEQWRAERLGALPTQLPAPAVRLMAYEIADTAAILAHEVLHTAWRRAAGETLGVEPVLDERLAWHRPDRPGQDFCAGPRMDLLSSLRTYSFAAAPDAVGETGPVGGALRAVRHYVNYLLEALVNGLLRHDLEGQLLHAHESACTSRCGSYRGFYGISCAPFVAALREG